MAADFPDDLDERALRRIAASGAKMSRPMDIDFQIAAPDEAIARHVADDAGKLGYRTSIYESPRGAWTCQCTKSMIASYYDVTIAQRELDALARPLGTRADGWGTYGGGKKYTRSGSAAAEPFRRPFQYSLRALLVANSALVLLCGLFATAFSTRFPMWTRGCALVSALTLTGGLIGAAIGYTIPAPHGNMVKRGATVGATYGLVLPPLLFVTFWLWVILETYRNFGVAG